MHLVKTKPMARIPADELQRIAKLSGYDRVLELDTASRVYGMSVDQIEAMLPSTGGGNASPNNINNDYANNGDQSQNFASKPNQINPSGMRFNYDPSVQAQENRKNVSQAITCPTCNAGLGIPSVRPIKVKCPACGSEAIFRD